jgi:ankyrin repeat protein
MDIWKYHLADSPARRGYDFFDDKPQIDLFGFSHLHFAVLGLDGTMFDTALSSASRLSVNGKDAMGRTALFWAALRGDITIVKKLLLKGADPDISDNRGSTPLHCAVTESPGQIIETLICAGADVNMTDCLGRTVLMELIRCREFEVEILQKLFEAGPHADSHSGQHQEPAKAVQQPYVRMHSSMSRNRPVQNDGRVDSRAVYDRTPLMSTNGRKNYEILKHLLQAGADYTFLDIEDRSILHIAADYGDLKTLAVLRQANLEYLWPDGKNKHGYKPMDIAIWRRDDNAGWSRWAIREPTVDPQEWFAAFEDLYLSIKCSHDKAYTERTRNTGKGANNKEPEVMKASTQIPL